MGIIETMARAYNKAVWGSNGTDKPILGQLEALKSALAAAEKAGWVLVPKEPTHEMRHRGDRECEHDGEPMKEIYSAMLAAAPKPE